MPTSHPVPSTARIQGWFEGLPAPWREQALRLRDLLLEASPQMAETWKYGIPFYEHRRWMCYLSLQKKGLVLGFVEGVHLGDPEGLFAPTDHAQIRHYLPPPAPAPLPEGALRRLIQQAVDLNERLVHEKLGKARRKRRSRGGR
ncbi:MAG: DUF1801 domain-containing protein [Flavobacteriales bacterium]|nr:DUF1801 domain-containing protein [Flavobacteriales bacterium]